MKEHLGEGEGQDANHGQGDQRLTKAWRTEGLLRCARRWSWFETLRYRSANSYDLIGGTQLQIADVEIDARLDDGFFHRVLPPFLTRRIRRQFFGRWRTVLTTRIVRSATGQ